MTGSGGDPRDRLVRDTLTLAGLITIVACAGIGLLGDPDLALTIALGAVIAAANFLLLAHGIARAIDRAGEGSSGHEGGSDPAHELDREASRVVAARAQDGLRSRFRLALLLLAMLGILWYMPARPEGLAVGVLIVLLAATIAGQRHNRAI